MLWSELKEINIRRLSAIAAAVHESYPEDEVVFAERLRLYPAGCVVLTRGAGEGAAQDGEIVGYGISHPWRFGEPPPLNSLLGALPDQPTTYYLHDVALLPEARGGGAGAAFVAHCVERAKAEGLRNLSLIAVHRSADYWRRHGFNVLAAADGAAADEEGLSAGAAAPAAALAVWPPFERARLAAKLRSYSADAVFMARALA